MSVSLGQLLLELKLDTSDYDQKLGSAKQHAEQIGREIERSLRGTTSLNLTPKVDDSALTKLNAHLHLKVKHFQQVQRFFDSKPLTPRTDTRSLDVLDRRLDAIERRMNALHRSPPNYGTLRLASPATQSQTVVTQRIQQQVEAKIDSEGIKRGFTEATQGLDSKIGEQVSKGVRNANKKGLFATIGEAVTSAPKSVFRGFYEGVGITYSQTLTRGFISGLEKELNVSLNKLGQNTAAKIAASATGVGNSLAQEFLGTNMGQAAKKAQDVFREIIPVNEMKGQLKELERAIVTTFDAVAELDFDRAGRAINQVGSAAKGVAAVPVAGVNNRRNRKQQDVIEKVRARADEIESTLPDVALGTRSINIVSGGFAGVQGKSSEAVAERFRMVAGNDALVDFIDNTDTDTSVNIGKTPKWLAQILGRFAKHNIVQGYNQDAVEAAAKALAYRRKAGADTPVNFVGYSGGGYVAKEAVELLEQMGVSAKGVGLGTPLFGLTGDNDPSKFRAYMGQNDPLGRLRPLLSSDQQFTSAGNAHKFSNYVGDRRMQSELSRFLGIGTTGAQPAQLELMGFEQDLEAIANDLTPILSDPNRAIFAQKSGEYKIYIAQIAKHRRKLELLMKDAFGDVAEQIEQYDEALQEAEKLVKATFGVQDEIAPVVRASDAQKSAVQLAATPPPPPMPTAKPAQVKQAEAKAKEAVKEIQEETQSELEEARSRLAQYNVEILREFTRVAGRSHTGLKKDELINNLLFQIKPQELESVIASVEPLIERTSRGGQKIKKVKSTSADTKLLEEIKAAETRANALVQQIANAQGEHKRKLLEELADFANANVAALDTHGKRLIAPEVRLAIGRAKGRFESLYRQHSPDLRKMQSAEAEALQMEGEINNIKLARVGTESLRNLRTRDIGRQAIAGVRSLAANPNVQNMAIEGAVGLAGTAGSIIGGHAGIVGELAGDFTGAIAARAAINTAIAGAKATIKVFSDENLKSASAMRKLAHVAIETARQMEGAEYQKAMGEGLFGDITGFAIGNIAGRSIGALTGIPGTGFLPAMLAVPRLQAMQERINEKNLPPPIDVDSINLARINPIRALREKVKADIEATKRTMDELRNDLRNELRGVQASPPPPSAAPLISVPVAPPPPPIVEERSPLPQLDVGETQRGGVAEYVRRQIRAFSVAFEQTFGIEANVRSVAKTGTESIARSIKKTIQGLFAASLPRVGNDAAELSQGNQRLTAQIKRNYSAIVESVAQASGIDAQQVDIPTLVVADDKLNELGARALYDIKNNQILISSEIAKILKSGPEELSRHAEELKDIVHEARHAAQFRFGKASLAGMAVGVQTPGVELFDPRNVPKESRYYAARSVQVANQQAQGLLPKAVLRQIYATEADAYAFEQFSPEILARAAATSKQKGTPINRVRSLFEGSGDPSSLGIVAQMLGKIPAIANLASEGLEQISRQILMIAANTASNIPVIGRFLEPLLQDAAQATGLIKPLLITFAGFSVLSMLGPQIIQFGQASSQAAREFGAFSRQIEFGIGSADEAEVAIARLETRANRLGVSLQASRRGYSQLTGATRDTSLEGEATERIFSSVQTAGAAMGLGVQDQELVFMAIAQMANKGVISMEELRQQLGERLPAASAIAARAMGMTTQEFFALVESGQLLSEEFLPKFGQQLEAEMGLAAERASESVSASFNRMDNSILKFQETVGAGILPAQKVGAEAFTAALNMAQAALSVLGKIIPSIVGLLVSRFGPSVLGVAKSFVISGAAAQLFGGMLNFLRTRLLETIGVVAKFLLKFAALQLIGEIVVGAFADMSGGAKDFADQSSNSLDRYLDKLEQVRAKTVEVGNQAPKATSFLGDRTFVGGIVSRISGDAGLKNLERAENFLVEHFNNSTLGLSIFAARQAMGDRQYRGITNYRENRENAINTQSQRLIDNSSTFLSQAQSVEQNELQRLIELEKQLMDLQTQRRLLMPGDTGNRQNLIEQEKALRQQMEAPAQAISETRTAFEQMQQSIEGAIENLRNQGASAEQIAPLENKLKELKTAQDRFNTSASRAVGIVQQLALAYAQVAGNLRQANQSIDVQYNQQRVAIAGQSLTTGERETMRSALEQNTTAQRIAALEKAQRELINTLESPDTQRVLELAGLSMQTSPEEIRARVAAMPSTAQGADRELLQQAAEQIEILNQRKVEISGLQAEIAEASLQAQQRLREASREVKMFLQQIENSAKDIALSTKQTQLDSRITNQRTRILSAIKGFSDDFFSGFANELIGAIELLFEPLKQQLSFEQQRQAAQQALQQVQNQAQQLQQQMPGAGMAIATNADGGASGGGASGGFFSPLRTASIAQLVSYQETQAQSFRARRNRNGQAGYHSGIDFDRRVGGSAGAEVIAMQGGMATISRIGRVEANGEGSMQIRVRFTDEQGRPIEYQYNHLSEAGVMRALGRASGTVQVRAGQVIGTVAQEDNISSGAHLDLKVRVGGQWVDPQQYLAARSGSGGTAETLNGQRVQINPVRGNSSNPALANAGAIARTATSARQRVNQAGQINRNHLELQDQFLRSQGLMIGEGNYLSPGELGGMYNDAAGARSGGRAAQIRAMTAVRRQFGQTVPAPVIERIFEFFQKIDQLRPEGDRGRTITTEAFGALFDRLIQNFSSNRGGGGGGGGGASSGRRGSGRGAVSRMSQLEPEFLQGMQGVAQRLGMNPAHLLALMGFETGGTFNPAEENEDSGATGLIQFIPSTARGLGTSTGRLAGMTRMQQLPYVERHLRPFRGRMSSLEDAYMAVLYPAAVGRGSGHSLFRRGSVTYRQNSGLDINRDGVITVQEAATRVRRYLPEAEATLGRSPSTASSGAAGSAPAMPGAVSSPEGNEALNGQIQGGLETANQTYQQQLANARAAAQANTQLAEAQRRQAFRNLNRNLERRQRDQDDELRNLERSRQDQRSQLGRDNPVAQVSQRLREAGRQGEDQMRELSRRIEDTQREIEDGRSTARELRAMLANLPDPEGEVASLIQNLESKATADEQRLQRLQAFRDATQGDTREVMQDIFSEAFRGQREQRDDAILTMERRRESIAAEMGADGNITQFLSDLRSLSQESEDYTRTTTRQIEEQTVMLESLRAARSELAADDPLAAMYDREIEASDRYLSALRRTVEEESSLLEQRRNVRGDRFMFERRTERGQLLAQNLRGRGFDVQARRVERTIAMEQNTRQFAGEMRGLEAFARSARLSQEQVAALRSELTALNEQRIDNIQNQFDTLQAEVLPQVQGAFKGLFSGLLRGTQSLEEVLAGFFDNLANMFAELASQFLVNELFGGLMGVGKSGGAGGLFGGLGGLFGGGKGGGGKNFGSIMGGGGGGLGGLVGGLFQGIIGLFNEGGLVKPMPGQEGYRSGNDAIARALQKEGPRSVLAALTPGELVLNTRQTRRFYQMGFDRVLNFAEGGVVPGAIAAPQLSGARSSSVNVTVPVTVESQGNGGGVDARRLGDGIQAAVRAEIVRQQKPGGSLYKQE